MMCLSVLVSLALVTQGPDDLAPRPELLAAWIAVGIGDGEASDAELRAKLGTDVRLYLVVEARVGREVRTYSDAPALKKRGRKVTATPWPKEYGKVAVEYFKLEPNTKDLIYDNTGELEHAWFPEERKSHPSGWHWCPIDYLETDTTWGSVWRHPADARPTLAKDIHGGLGTMRFVVKVAYRGRTVFSPGKERRDKTGLLPGIATVRLRRDDTAVGYMTELINVPYIYGSSTATGSERDQQAERAVGADCADLIVYGWRRLGKKIAYTWTGGLKGMTNRRALVDRVEGDRYRTGDGSPIKFGREVQVGDLLLWGRHVAVVAEADPTGYLTPETKILNTVWESPMLVPLKDIGFGFDKSPFDLRRARWEKKK